MRWVTSVAAAFVASASFASDGPLWQFDGRFGPDYWDQISGANEICAQGKQQSPIDIIGAYDTSLFTPEIDWAQDGWVVANTGTMLELQNPNGGHTMIGETSFQLSRVLFRQPAEHLIDGHRAAMEVQFYHENDDQPLIMSVFLETGGQQELLERIVGLSPLKPNQKPVGLPRNDLTELLPDLTDAWVYRGSITTPPCSEGVLWMVFMDPTPISNAAYLAFGTLHKPNARPVQPLYGRFVLTD